MSKFSAYKPCTPEMADKIMGLLHQQSDHYDLVGMIGKKKSVGENARKPGRIPQGRKCKPRATDSQVELVLSACKKRGEKLGSVLYKLVAKQNGSRGSYYNYSFVFQESPLMRKSGAAWITELLIVELGLDRSDFESLL